MYRYLAFLSLFGCATGSVAAGASTDSTSEPDKADTPPPVKNERPVLIRAAAVWTITGDTLTPGEVLIVDGKIAAVGTELEVPPDAQVIEAPKGHLTPGLIDTHSHLGVYPTPYVVAHEDGNEATSPVTAEVEAVNSFWPQDPGIPRALAGGVTTMQILPGSANLIGGRGFVVKLRPKRSSREMRFPGSPDTLKMACGENPKRVHGGRSSSPRTRMGNVAGYRAAFQQAAEYREEWRRYEKKAKKYADEKKKSEFDDGEFGYALEDKGGKDDKDDKDDPPVPPDRNWRLETLRKVLEGEILVQIHCYRADEMLYMLSIADEFGFKIRSFHHAVEAYKIRDVLAKRQVGVSTWPDWWGFKMEAFDGIVENAAYVAAAGGRAIIHSDSERKAQRLNQDAAKVYFKGEAMGLGLPQKEALRWVTLNPAWAIGIDDQVGSIEKGKVADLVLWNGPPLSVYALADKVFMDGVLEYERAKGMRRTDFELGIIEEGAR